MLENVDMYTLVFLKVQGKLIKRTDIKFLQGTQAKLFGSLFMFPDFLELDLQSALY